ncbi:MAG TPA: lysophospholipid acyltransferase family protein [Polyangiaceae bacterium]
MRTLLAVIACIQLFLVASIGFVFVALVFLPTFWFDKKRLLCGRTLRYVAVAAIKTSPVWRFRIHGEVPRKGPGRAVCVSNHCSHVDVFLISHVPWEMKWLAKRSLFNIPFIGWGMWLAMDVPIRRASPAAAKAALDECARWLERDVPVMIFPEGTRSKTGELQPFKDGAFRLAIDTGADVLPMAVAGTGAALVKDDWRPRRARGALVIGKPISTQGMTVADVPRLKEAARAQILALREQALPFAGSLTH